MRGWATRNCRKSVLCGFRCAHSKANGRAGGTPWWAAGYDVGGAPLSEVCTGHSVWNMNDRIERIQSNIITSRHNFRSGVPDSGSFQSRLFGRRKLVQSLVCCRLCFKWEEQFQSTRPGRDQLASRAGRSTTIANLTAVFLCQQLHRGPPFDLRIIYRSVQHVLFKYSFIQNLW